jgi:radical SAM superfamily enzyme YgiQ (UPF0313 family)
VKITFVYPAFERHAQAHPELLEHVPASEYIGPPSLGIASVAAQTPAGHEVSFIDDRVTPFDPRKADADLYALSFFTPAATRAMEIGDQLRAAGKKVVMGGIFPSNMPAECEPHCDAVVVGEGEPVWPQVVQDAAAGKLQKRYVAPLCELDKFKPPRVDLYLNAERDGYRPDDYPLQVSRGCPLQCDACVLPIYLGKKSRFFPTDNVVDTMKQYAKAGKLLSLTEDTSFFPGARKSFRAFLDTVLGLQKEGHNVRISYIGISMPMILNLDPTIVEQLQATKMDRFYLVGGFDPITRNAFGKGDKDALDKAERAIKRCQDAGIDPYVSFLAGNPDDDEGTFDRMIEFAKKTKIDLAEFAVSTPYPNTPMWHKYVKEDRIFDRQWKHYNDANVVFRPHKMTAERLQEGYLFLWKEFYKGRNELTGRDHTRKTIQF